MPKPPSVFAGESGPKFTDEETRYLGTLARSPQGQALQKALNVWRLYDRAELLDPETDHERTQYVRGRLALLRDLALLLEQDAPARYEQQRKATGTPRQETP